MISLGTIKENLEKINNKKKNENLNLLCEKDLQIKVVRLENVLLELASLPASHSAIIPIEIKNALKKCGVIK